jgi:large subunit ribosomal protein L21
MYAIVEIKGKQYKVKKGDVIDVDLLQKNGGEKVEFKDVLFLREENSSKIGTPHLKCSVEGVVLGDVKDKKVVVYKYKRRKNYRRKQGHRQKYTTVKITEIKKVS